MFIKLLVIASSLVAATVLSACAGFDPADRGVALQRADAAGLSEHRIPAGRFVLHARLRSDPSGGPILAVFLEGDGFAWIDRATPSRDPTPHRPVALALASRSEIPAVAYLARPCQWVADDDRRGCDARWWTSHRLAEETVDAADAAIDALKREAGARALLLVGHSGGGGLAALLAARRSDVAGLVTVAGVTDLGAWTALHGVSAMPESLDPAAARDGWERVPQIHFLGENDTVVPPGAAATWSAPTVVVAGAGHLDGWSTRWPALERRALESLGVGLRLPPPSRSKLTLRTTGGFIDGSTYRAI